jgi:putative acetyltransferase
MAGISQVWVIVAACWTGVEQRGVGDESNGDMTEDRSQDQAPVVELVTPATPALLDATRGIFAEYASSLNVDLCFQFFDQELAQLPGEYAAPHGALLLALVDGEVAGCGALRPLPDVDYPNACEMKRLYVRPAFRRFGLGRQLAQALMDRALQAGYSTLLLDTLDDMEAARGLYTSLGFEEIPPYYFNPIAGAHYLCAHL